MSRNFLLALLGGLVAVILIVVFSLEKNKGSHVRLEGKVTKVRVISTGDNSSVAVLELRITNPAGVLFLVEQSEISVKLPNGATAQGQPVVEADLDRILAYYPAAGPRFNPNLRMREKILPGATVDRTLAFAFEHPAPAIEKRAALTAIIHDADNYRVEIPETPQAR